MGRDVYISFLYSEEKVWRLEAMTSMYQSVGLEIWIEKKNCKKIFPIQRRLSINAASILYHQLLTKFQKGIICQTFQLYIYSDESTTDT